MHANCLEVQGKLERACGAEADSFCAVAKDEADIVALADLINELAAV